MSQEQKATLEIAYERHTDTMFDLSCPVSIEYEVTIDIDRDLAHVDDPYLRNTLSQTGIKYSQGILKIHVACEIEASIDIEVKDANQTYEVHASADYENKECIELKNVDATYTQEGYEDEEDFEEEGEKA